MRPLTRSGRLVLAAIAACLGLASSAAGAAKEPAFSPFGPRKVGLRDDAIPGAVYHSSGQVVVGGVHLTRDKKLRVFVEKDKEHHWIPLGAVKRITAVIAKQWKEKHWRWLENANDKKVYTGRFYPVRMYEYDITLKNDKTVRAKRLYTPLYIQDEKTGKSVRLILHHRDKGKLDQPLSKLAYVKKIELGEKAKADAVKFRDAMRRRAAKPKADAPADAAKKDADAPASETPKASDAEPAGQ